MANPGHTLLLEGSLYCQPINTLDLRASGAQKEARTFPDLGFLPQGTNCDKRLIPLRLLQRDPKI